MFKRMMFFLFLFASVSLVFLPGCLSQKQSIEFDGRTRTFITHLPPQYDNTALFPLVIVLHGGAGNGLNAEQMTGIAPVAASIGGKAAENSSLWTIPSPEKELSVIAFNGMLDGNVPYDGGQPTADNTKGAYSYLSVEKSISFWVEHNNCSPTPGTDISDNGNIITDTYPDGNNNTEVVLYSIADGKHAWPGGEKGWFGADEPTQEISATDIMWEFFSRHDRQE